MNPARLAAFVVVFVAGLGAGAWWMDARRAAEIAELERAAARSLVADLAQLSGSVPGPALPLVPPQPGSAAATSSQAPALRAADGAASGSGRSMPEPPASWMTLEQQRAAALAYREWVRESARLAGDRIANLNAELFMIEGQDPAWGATMESRVRASLASNKVFEDAELRSIECRVTVCRASLLFAAADNPRALRHGGMSPWSEWRNAQIIPVRQEIDDGTPGFHATVFLGEDFDQRRLPRGALPPGPGGP